MSHEVSITVTDRRLNDGAPTNINLVFPGSTYAGGKPTQEQYEAAIGFAVGRQAAGANIPAFRSIEEGVAAAQARSDAYGHQPAAPASAIPGRGVDAAQPMLERAMGAASSAGGAMAAAARPLLGQVWDAAQKLGIPQMALDTAMQRGGIEPDLFNASPMQMGSNNNLMQAWRAFNRIWPGISPDTVQNILAANPDRSIEEHLAAALGQAAPPTPRGESQLNATVTGERVTTMKPNAESRSGAEVLRDRPAQEVSREPISQGEGYQTTPADNASRSDVIRSGPSDYSGLRSGGMIPLHQAMPILLGGGA